MKDKKELEERLWEVHEALIDHFLYVLKNKEEIPKGSTLDVIRAFLRDNAISRNELKKTAPFDAIGEMLETWNEEESPKDDNRGFDDGLKIVQ